MSAPGLELLYSQRMLALAAFVHEGTIQKAARSLQLSVSAVSRHLSHLEEAIGVDLLDRSGYPCRPTQVASELVRLAESQQQPIEELLVRIRSHGDVFPVLRVGVLQTLSLNLGTEFLTRMKRHAGRVFCLTGSSANLFPRLLAGDIDLTMASRPYDDAQGFRRQLLFEEPMVLLLPKALAASRSHWGWQELHFCGLPYIRNYRLSAGLVAENYLNDIGQHFPNTIEMDNTALITSLIGRGVGWGLARPTALLAYTRLLADVTILPVPDPMQIKCWLISSQSVPEKLHQKTAEVMTEIFGEFAPLLARQFREMKEKFFLGVDDGSGHGKPLFPSQRLDK
jgi:DNA-binding transcriptional LysR family regulator